MPEQIDPRWRFLGDIRGRAAWVVLGCLICQLGLGFGYVLGPLAGDILSEFGWTRAQLSGARFPQLLATSVTSPFVGWLVIRFGARGVLSAAAVILGISFVGLSAVQSLGSYYFFIIVMGLAVTGLGDITVGTAVSDWVTRNRGAALGIVYTGSNLGGWGLTRVASSISQSSDWRTALLWIGIGGTAAILPVAAFAIRKRTASDQIRLPEPRDAPSPAATGDTSSLSVRDALRTRSFWILSVALFAFFFYFLSVIEHLVLFLTGAGLAKDEAVGHFSNAIGLGIISKLGAGLLADRIPQRAVLALDFALLTASSLALLVLPDPNWIWLFVVCYGFATAARDIAYPLAIQYCFGDRFMPQIYGMMMLVLVGGALGPLFGGWVFDQNQSYQFAFSTYALFNAAAFVGCCFIRDERVRTRD
jgi:MFS family permease